VIATALLATACGDDSDPPQGGSDGVIITPLGTPAETVAPTEPSGGATNGAAPVPTSEPVDTTLSGFIFPIEGGCLPSGDQLMPNAPRDYRNGTHEGVDFYNVDNCTFIDVDTPVIAAKDGVVTRADHDYVNLTAEEYAEVAENLTSAESLDVFRGRQVWIDHGNGIVTRYCHLNGIAAGVTPGTTVSAGDLVAYVGESGTPESINNPGSQYHLHFELRVGDSYLGAGLPPQEVRALYQELFGQ